MTFAEQIREVRQKLYLSQSEMAKELGVTELTIFRWEHDLSKPHISSKRKFMALCKKKKIKIDENIL